MIGAISGVTGARPVYQMSPVAMKRNSLPGVAADRTAQPQQTAQTQQSQQSAAVWTARRAANPDQPVQPVKPVTGVDAKETGAVNLGLPIREGVDPVEMAVRMRIRYDDPMADAQAGGAVNGEAAQGVESAQQAAEDGKCQTCEERKYQDGSDDMGVSFQTPTRIDPDQVASAVRGHEMEHVVREQAKAQREDRKVVSQSVSLHTNICPECGKSYISGGTTRTVTAANNEQPAPDQQDRQQRQPFSAIA